MRVAEGSLREHDEKIASLKAQIAEIERKQDEGQQRVNQLTIRKQQVLKAIDKTKRELEKAGHTTKGPCPACERAAAALRQETAASSAPSCQPAASPTSSVKLQRKRSTDSSVSEESKQRRSNDAEAVALKRPRSSSLGKVIMPSRSYSNISSSSSAPCTAANHEEYWDSLAEPPDMTDGIYSPSLAEAEDAALDDALDGPCFLFKNQRLHQIRKFKTELVGGPHRRGEKLSFLVARGPQRGSRPKGFAMFKEQWDRRGSYTVELLWLGVDQAGADAHTIEEKMLNEVISRLDYSHPGAHIKARGREKPKATEKEHWKRLGFTFSASGDDVTRTFA